MVAELILGDCLEELNKLEENSIDTCITDPPYHLTSIVERFGKKGSAPAKGGVYERSSRGFMGKCYDKETELLTEDGWLKIDTIVNERYAGNFYSLNPGTNEIELCKATKHMQYKFNGDLLHFTGRSIDLMVTPNHKLWISAYGKKPEFVEADKVPRAFSMFNQGRWRGGEEPEFIEIIGKKYPAKAFMRFLGIYLGDGCVVVRKAQPKKQNFISLSARKERKKAAFKECLEQLGVKFTQYNKQTLVYDKVLNEYLVVLGKAPDKYIPNEYFDYSESLLLELLRGLLETDGYVSKSRKCVQYYTTSKRLADDIQRLLLHCGISGTLIYKKPKEANICGIKVAGSHLYIVTILQNNKKLWFEKTDHKNGKRRLLKVPYSDFVYDVELEKNHILMARRNGRTIWSSNSWDGGDIAFNPQTWEAVYRVLKPGAMLLAFGGTRTYHRLACAIEDAGFVIVDQIAWVYGVGFPKSHNIGKAIDRHLGKEPKIVSQRTDGRYAYSFQETNNQMGQLNPRKSNVDKIGQVTEGATPEARLWGGWGTALKPAHEPICVAMKPRDGTYANNALKWGVAGLWIDGGRVGTDEELGRICTPQSPTSYSLHDKREWVDNSAGKGRFPANFVHDGSDEVVGLFPQTTSGKLQPHHVEKHGHWSEQQAWSPERDYGGDSGSAARFFYCAKASKSEREAGLEEVEFKIGGGMKGTRDQGLLTGSGNVRNNVMKNHHPTIKPIALMEYLVRLTKTPTGGIVLDPFMGSGTTGIACVNEGRDFIGIEKEPEYFEIAQKRIEVAQMQPRLL